MSEKSKGLSPKITLIAAAVLLIAAVVWFTVAYGSAIKTIDPVTKGVYTFPDEIGYTSYLDIEVQSGSDTLKGWYIPADSETGNPGDRVVIMSHNYESTREMLDISGMYFYRYLLDSGYDVVTFDYSGSGLSSGKYYTFGSSEKTELLSVINYVHELVPDADIALCGWAFGAAAAISAGCESGYVKAVISDSSFTDLSSFLDSTVGFWTGLPSWLFGGIEKGLMSAVSGADFKSLSPVSSLKNTSGKSFFFIHGNSDTVVSPKEANTLYTAAIVSNKADIWIIDSVPHIGGFVYQEENYANKIINFLNVNLAS